VVRFPRPHRAQPNIRVKGLCCQTIASITKIAVLDVTKVALAPNGSWEMRRISIPSSPDIGKGRLRSNLSSGSRYLHICFPESAKPAMLTKNALHGDLNVSRFKCPTWRLFVQVAANDRFREPRFWPTPRFIRRETSSFRSCIPWVVFHRPPAFRRLDTAQEQACLPDGMTGS